MLILNTPESADTNIPVSLGGVLYDFHYKYNGTSECWYVDLYLNNQLLVGSLKLVEGTLPLMKYNLAEFNHGQLIVVKFKKTEEPCGRHNLGIGKDYSLVYISNEELSEG